ncbi:MAG: hypothetical protein HZC28_07100 [Spirochaetes bacterium]|nr:hypothetical protein [Spirochaetota bacterium]
MESEKGTFGIRQFYTSTERFIALFRKEARQYPVATGSLEAYAAWKQKVRARLWEITGLNRMEKSDLKPEHIESIACDGYRRDTFLIWTEPDVAMPFDVLVPDGCGPSDRRIPIIAPHGHSSGGRLSTTGRADIDPIRERLAVTHHDYGRRFAEAGYIVFCPDARGFGDRREWMHQDEKFLMSSSCMALNHMAISLGRSLTGLWAWDNMRLIDYIQSRDDCRSERLACAGLSGGGLQTLWLAALDDRVKLAVTSGYFYGYEDALLRLSNNCSCNYVPHLWETVDMGDIGALIAPRPFLIETGNIDPLNGATKGLKNVEEQVAITREAYQLFNAEEHLLHHVFAGPHRWDGEKTRTFIKKYL